MTRCHEDEFSSKVLNFLERLDDRIGCAHEETVTVMNEWLNILPKSSQAREKPPQPHER